MSIFYHLRVYILYYKDVICDAYQSLCRLVEEQFHTVAQHVLEQLNTVKAIARKETSDISNFILILLFLHF